jgi:hypothetical protein
LPPTEGRWPPSRYDTRGRRPGRSVDAAPDGRPGKRTVCAQFPYVAAGLTIAPTGRVSAPRPIFKGVTYMLTRRVRQRLLLLKPSPITNQVVGYVIAVMAQKWNMAFHEVMVMGNHWHPVMTDLDGNAARFEQDCHQFIARALNRYHGDSESLWANTQSNRVECVEGTDIINKIAYAMANPVEGRLVRYGHNWPGLRRAWPSKPLTFRRPKKFFRGQKEGGPWPEEATLEFTRPPGFDDVSDEDLAASIKSAIDEREEKFRKQYDAEGKSFLGRRRVLEQSRYSQPQSEDEPRGIKPKLACRNKWRRIERLQQDKRWLNGYRQALPRWCAGDRDVVFPAGTYKMRILHGVRCAEGPD